MKLNELYSQAYYKNKYGMLLNMDCVEAMKLIDDNSIDLVITDPPYKLNKTTGSPTSTSMQNKWKGNLKAGDKTASIINEIKFSEWLPDLYRILKTDAHCYIWTNDKNLCDLQNECEKVGFKLHNILICKKNNCTPNRWYMKNCEFILFLHKGKSFPIKDLGCPHFFEYENIVGKNKLHPTQKPENITEKLLLNSSNENDIVFDPFMGSGTTAKMAQLNNRKWIGCEISKEYCDIIKNRLESINEN